MNFSELQTDTRGILNNLHTSHPLMVSGTFNRTINWAQNRLIRMAVGPNAPKPNLFPELEVSWTTNSDTVVGRGYIELPNDKLAITGMWSYDAIGNPDRSLHMRYPMKYRTRALFQSLDREATGYPRLWTMAGNRVEFWPTPTAGHLTRFDLLGIQRLPDMSAPNDTPKIDEVFHPLIAMLAAARLATYLGWTAKSQELNAAVIAEVGTTINTAGLNEEAQWGETIGVEGYPTNLDLYGR